MPEDTNEKNSPSCASKSTCIRIVIIELDDPLIADSEYDQLFQGAAAAWRSCIPTWSRLIHLLKG